jgi:hypothetical protein
MVIIFLARSAQRMYLGMVAAESEWSVDFACSRSSWKERADVDPLKTISMEVAR